MQSMFLSSSSRRYSRVVGRFGPTISLASVCRPSYRSAARAQVTPGSPIDAPSRPLPCIPTPTMPNRTVSLGAKGRNVRGLAASEAPAAAPNSRNSRRVQGVFIWRYWRPRWNSARMSIPPGPTRREYRKEMQSHAVHDHREGDEGRGDPVRAERPQVGAHVCRDEEIPRGAATGRRPARLRGTAAGREGLAHQVLRRQTHRDRRALHRGQRARRRLYAHPGEVARRGARMDQALPQPRAHGRRDRSSPTVRARGPVMRGMRKFDSVADYLKAVPPAQRTLLKKVRQTIRAAAPKATEVISYGIPGYKHHGMLVYFAAFKDHCSLFGVGTALMKEHRKALAPYKKSTGTIQFTVDKPLSLALVRKLVKARVAQNEARR